MSKPNKRRGLRAAAYGTLAAVVASIAVAGVVTPAQSEVPVAPITPKVIGMSAPASLWDQRISEVGENGVTARRIFATLSSDGQDQSDLIEAAVAAGQLPVISYKVPSVSTLLAGGYDSWLTATQTYLTSLGVQVTVTFWHEPHGDMTPADFRAGSQKFIDLVQAPNVAVGPILNGWLLDNKVSTFASYTDATLLDEWDFVAVDSYQNGTATSPGPLMPARAVPLLEDWLDQQGHPDLPIGVGEYNGHTAEAIEYAGETILSTPEVWFGLVWNSTAGTALPLEGDRLTAYQETKADPRAYRNDC